MIKSNSRRSRTLSRLRIEELQSHGLGPVSLMVEAGECIAVSGASGAGKTLMLRAIADLDPYTGAVFLDGYAAAGFRPQDWRRQVGYLPAESHWWHETVGPHFTEVDESALEAVGFGREVMEWQIARLSTGERQRLALLRLLANRPRVLLLDEPTAALDPTSVTRVEELLLRFRQQHDVGILWVSHDPQQIRRVAHRHYRIEQGALVQQEPAAWASSR